MSELNPTSPLNAGVYTADSTLPIDRLNASLSELREIEGYISIIEDKIFGPQPQSPGNTRLDEAAKLFTGAIDPASRELAERTRIVLGRIASLTARF